MSEDILQLLDVAAGIAATEANSELAAVLWQAGEEIHQARARGDFWERSAREAGREIEAVRARILARLDSGLPAWVLGVASDLEMLRQKLVRGLL